MNVVDTSGNVIELTIPEGTVASEVVKAETGELYEVIEISDDSAKVELLTIEEDWGE